MAVSTFHVDREDRNICLAALLPAKPRPSLISMTASKDFLFASALVVGAIALHKNSNNNKKKRINWNCTWNQKEKTMIGVANQSPQRYSNKLLEQVLAAAGERDSLAGRSNRASKNLIPASRRQPMAGSARTPSIADALGRARWEWEGVSTYLFDAAAGSRDEAAGEEPRAGAAPSPSARGPLQTCSGSVHPNGECEEGEDGE